MTETMTPIERVEKAVNDLIAEYKKLFSRIRGSYGWMIEDMMKRFDDTSGRPGDYGDDLSEAEKVWQIIKDLTDD